MLFILRDNYNSDVVYGVIKSDTSTREEIQEAIANIRVNTPDYQWDDMIECLPKDCVVIDIDKKDTIYF